MWIAADAALIHAILATVQEQQIRVLREALLIEQPAAAAAAADSKAGTACWPVMLHLFLCDFAEYAFCVQRSLPFCHSALSIFCSSTSAFLLILHLSLQHQLLPR